MVVTISVPVVDDEILLSLQGCFEVGTSCQQLIGIRVDTITRNGCDVLVLLAHKVCVRLSHNIRL